VSQFSGLDTSDPSGTSNLSTVSLTSHPVDDRSPACDPEFEIIELFVASFMLCYVMLCYVMLCYVMLCCVMLCYAMLCYVYTDIILWCIVLLEKLIVVQLAVSCYLILWP
jgi:hypothetical protein